MELMTVVLLKRGQTELEKSLLDENNRLAAENATLKVDMAKMKAELDS